MSKLLRCSKRLVSVFEVPLATSRRNVVLTTSNHRLWVTVFAVFNFGRKKASREPERPAGGTFPCIPGSQTLCPLEQVRRPSHLSPSDLLDIFTQQVDQFNKQRREKEKKKDAISQIFGRSRRLLAFGRHDRRQWQQWTKPYLPHVSHRVSLHQH